MFRSTPREGTTAVPTVLVLFLVVSIHAPVKEATLATPSCRQPEPVSIHAPVKEATAY
jgi:hypothetical protein